MVFSEHFSIIIFKKEVIKLSELVEADYKALAANIYRFRVLQGMTQAKLAELSNVSSSYISQIECVHLHKGITYTSVAKIAEALGVPSCVLLVHEPCNKYLECLGKITANAVQK